MTSPYRVHKFGGSSVADAACMRQVAQILLADPHPRLAVVVSACKGVTDALIGLVTAAAAADDGVDRLIGRLVEQHRGLATELLNAAAASAFHEVLDSDGRDIGGLLQTVRLIRQAPPALRDRIAGYGELWSSRVLAGHLAAEDSRGRSISWVDGRDLIHID